MKCVTTLKSRAKTDANFKYRRNLLKIKIKQVMQKHKFNYRWTLKDAIFTKDKTKKQINLIKKQNEKI